MLRRLLTCLALITGLAAAGAPAHAAMFDAADERVASSECSRADNAQRCVCAPRKRDDGNRGDNARGCKLRKTVTIIIPTVQFGPDRAFE